MLWLILALMSAAVLIALVRPLLAPDRNAAPSSLAATAVYRHQLAEIDTEAERGLLAPEEADAARREVARRLLAAADETAAASAASAAAAGSTTLPPAPYALTPTRLGAVIAFVVPVAAIALYAAIGDPSLPARPATARPAVPPPNPELARLITAVEQRLKTHPEDGRGWDVIAPVYLRLARFDAAADAYSRAMTLLGETPARLAGLAEALMLANDGRVTPDARVVLEKLVKREPGHMQARFWLAFAKEQDGYLAEAAADYGRLLAEAPAGASWRPMLEERHAALRTALGEAPAASGPPPPLSTLPPTPAAAAPGPSSDDIAAAERLAPADRQAMIDRMVAGLAERLAKDGRDLAGWQRLIRALTVLGRKAEAVAALGRARQAFAGEPRPLAELGALATSLGLGS